MSEFTAEQLEQQIQNLNEIIRVQRAIIDDLRRDRDMLTKANEVLRGLTRSLTREP